MGKAILEVILVSLKIFSDERKRYFENKTKKLMAKIHEVEDSSFYDKDMEAKGIAERQLILEIEELRQEYMMEVAR